jgi:hypothetical protein
MGQDENGGVGFENQVSNCESEIFVFAFLVF